MKTIIYYGAPAYGHINPSLAYVSALVKKGYQITYYATRDFQEKIQQAGVNFRAYPPTGSNALATITKATTLKTHLWQAATLSLQASLQVGDALIQEAREINPDLIIHDSIMAIGRFIAEKLAVPTLCFNSYIPMDGLFNQTGRLYTKYFIRALLLDSPHFFKYFQSRRAVKFKFAVKNLNFLSLFYNKAAFNLVSFNEELHPNGADFNQDYFFMGPTGILAPQPEMRDFQLPDQPFIYVTLGTIAQDSKFISAILNQLGQWSIPVILSLGANKVSQPLPKNIRAYSFVPQKLVLSAARLILTTGGMNTLNEAIRARVPILIYPFLGEQKINADQIESLHLGRRLRRLNQLKETVQEMLTHFQLPDPAFTNQMTQTKIEQAVTLTEDYLLSGANKLKSWH